MSTNTEQKKVIFGLKNVYYAVFNETQGSYGTPKHIPGGVSLSITREGNSDTFYADDAPYLAFETNAGYTGDLEMAYLPKDVYIDLLGYIEDSHHMVIEDSDAKPVRFALLYEVGSNLESERFVFYDCTLSRPENEANTKTDSTDPDTQTMAITMIPHEFAWGTNATKKITKAYIVNDTDGTTTYNAWFTQVTLPTPKA